MESEGISVGIRIRPTESQQRAFVRSGNAVSQVGDNQTYYYDQVFDENSRNADVYEYLGRKIVTDIMNGINGTIFACKKTRYLFSITVSL
jgi:hypothetical protein